MRAQTELCYYNAGLKTKQMCYKGLCPSSEQPESVQHHELNNSLLVETAQPTFTWGLQKAHSRQQLLI